MISQEFLKEVIPDYAVIVIVAILVIFFYAIVFATITNRILAASLSFLSSVLIGWILTYLVHTYTTH